MGQAGKISVAAAHGPHADPDAGAGDFQPTQMMSYADAVKAGFTEPVNRPPSRAAGEEPSP